MKTFVINLLKFIAACVLSVVLTAFVVLLILLILSALNIHISNFAVGYMFASIINLYAWDRVKQIFWKTSAIIEVDTDESK